ncbi:hypothetical protein [Sphingomonas antarctica]|uniref:hypothetical protein n=1 Tax=Sphingomonas antarctica TaxID=2040274 RepID=UPI0039E89AEA
MPPASLGLVVLAALIHATWNLFAKRAAGAGAVFVLVYSAISALAYAPFAIWQIANGNQAWSVTVFGFLLLSGALHFVYSLTLQRGYRAADLSVVYPVARHRPGAVERGRLHPPRRNTRSTGDRRAMCGDCRYRAHRHRRSPRTLS